MHRLAPPNETSLQLTFKSGGAGADDAQARDAKGNSESRFNLEANDETAVGWVMYNWAIYIGRLFSYLISYLLPIASSGTNNGGHSEVCHAVQLRRHRGSLRRGHGVERTHAGHSRNDCRFAPPARNSVRSGGCESGKVRFARPWGRLRSRRATNGGDRCHEDD